MQKFASQGYKADGCGKYWKAIKLYDLEIEAHKGKCDYRLFFNKGIALSALYKYEEAIDCYLLGTKQARSKFWGFYYNIGNCYYKLNQVEKAILNYQESITCNDCNLVLVYYNLGTCFYKIGQLRRALECYDKCLKKDGVSKCVISNKISIFLVSNDLINATMSLQYAFANQGSITSQKFHYLYAVLYLKHLRYKKAMKQFEACSSINIVDVFCHTGKELCSLALTETVHKERLTKLKQMYSRVEYNRDHFEINYEFFKNQQIKAFEMIEESITKSVAVEVIISLLHCLLDISLFSYEVKSKLKEIEQKWHLNRL